MGVYTPTRSLYKPADGETGWGDLVNANWDNLDATANTSAVTSGDAATLASAKSYTDSAVAGITSPVTSVAGKTGAVTLVEGDIQGLTADLAAKAPLASPALTGTPTAPTPTAADNSTNIATTAYVQSAVGTAVGGITFPVTSVAGKTGAVTLVEGDITGLTADLAAKAPLASPTLTGAPKAPTPTAGDSSTNIATTAFVAAAVAGGSIIVARTIQRPETASDANLLTYTPPAVAGVYRINVVFSVSAVSSTTLSWTLTYTDANGNAKSPGGCAFSTVGAAGTVTSLTPTAGTTYYGSIIIDVNNSGTPIVVKTGNTGASISYMASAIIERLG